MKEVSVIIVHKYTNIRYKYLLECIQSLSHQTYKNFELILVIDSINVLLPELKKILKTFSCKVNFSKGQRGAAWNRKIGLEIATCNYVAFIDDDAVAMPNWLNELIKQIKKGDVIGVGGKTLASKVQTLPERFSDFNKSQRFPKLDNENRIFNICTVNSCFKRKALISTKLIHDNYIYFAKQGIYFWFEDYDITYRIGEKFGYDKLAIAENAIVYHNHRATFKEAFKQKKGYGMGAAFFLWNYNLKPKELKGKQELPDKLLSIKGHVFKLSKSLLNLSELYKNARKENESRYLSFMFFLHGFALMIAFHTGTYNSARLLSEYNWTKLDVNNKVRKHNILYK